MCKCNAGLNQYHGVFTCRKCKEIIYDLNNKVHVDKEEKKLAIGLTNVNK